MSLFNNKSTQQTPIFEWILGALGAGLLVTCIGFLIWKNMHGTDEPGAVTVDMIRITSFKNQYLLEFAAHNSGSQALAALNVTARLLDGEQEIESAQAVIDYLPGGSTRKGGFYLRADPRAHKLELNPGGYQLP